MGAWDNRRHWTLAVLMQIGIRIKYAVLSGFGFIPLFCPINAYPSRWRPKNCPKYDWITRVGFVWIWFITAFAREGVLYPILCKTGVMSLLSMLHSWLSSRLIAQFKERGYTEVEREVPIPEYDWKNGDPETFNRTFVKNPHPVILRGFMNDTNLLKELKWDRVMEKYGDDKVLLTKQGEDGVLGKLSEVDDPKVYLHNSLTLFGKYPDLTKVFEYEKLEPYMHMKVGFEQIFVGREGTGSPFHHAAVYNMFYMIDGSKTWWFIDPYDAYLVYPAALLGKAAGVAMCLWPDEYNKEAFPLFKYCPVYKASLQPGDVLFNPPWWWHSIKNTTPVSVGVASRWHTDGIAGHKLVMTEEDYDVDRVASFFFMMGATSWGYLHKVLQTPVPKFDEHATLFEAKSRYVSRQLKFSEDGGIDMFGVKTKF